MIERKKLSVSTRQAPLLPVPKNRWDDLVYLHGLLPLAPSDSELDHLVVSSGDFGLAYLIERWAARFVSELFRHYTVCFVGYSLNDPVLRYMMDALAADRQRGEVSLEMYAFGSYKKSKEAAYEAEWRAKNVTPILYQETKAHQYLHKTLQRWSATYRDGVRGKELIIVKEAIANPLIRTREDDFVGRVLWALSHESGLPAKRFAEMNPVPSLDWLEPLRENRYRQGDLGRFGVPAKPDRDDKLAFSLMCRPAPYGLAPLMALCDAGATGSQWDDVMVHLAHWLTRHLDDPTLVLWLAKRGGQLHERFTWLVDKRLDEISKLERGGDNDKLDRLRAAAPRAVPRPLLRTVWRLLLSGRITSGRQGDLYSWKKRLQRDGWVPSLRLSLRELLTPCIQLREPFRWGGGAGEEKEPQHLKEILDWELKLRASHVHSVLRILPDSPEWQVALPDLLPDFTVLLRDTLDLMRELGSADERNDHSYVHQPSISKHPQNRNFHDWTALIELNRDAWLALAHRSVEQARLVAQQWQQTPYPLFKRLAFFAAAQETIVPPPLALDWLLSDNGWWLWSVETQRETLRLLVALAPQLEPADLGRLEAAILAGPPRTMYKDDLDTERWTQIVDHKVWSLLAKMVSSGVPLGQEAQAATDALCADHPQWQREEEGERDEFPFWMGTGDESREIIVTPRRRRELVEWLKQHPHTDSGQEDDWQQRCRDEFVTTAYALYALSQEGVWPNDRWREALQAWAEETLVKRSWLYMAPVLARAPAELIVALAHSLSWWLQASAKSFVGHQVEHQGLFFTLCRQILNLDYEDEVDANDPVNRAINHPVGKTTEALLRWWYGHELKDDQHLVDDLEPIFTSLCDSRASIYRHARVLLAKHVVTLFRVDSEWTKRNLLPHFNWQKSATEARAAWDGFLWSPRLYSPLFEIIKPDFLNTVRHYVELGDFGRQYAALLTFAALEPRDTFTTDELKAATEALPEGGRQEAVQTLVEVLEGAGEQRAEYWRNRVLPYWNSIWPKSRDQRTPALAEPIALLCIAAREDFPEALQVLRPWLQPVQYPDYVVHCLDESALSSRYPAAALEFLSIIVASHVQWPPSDLANCLKEIKAAAPALEGDERFRRLMELQRQHE